MDQTRVSFEESERFTDVNGFTVHTNEAGSGPVLFGFHGGGPGANAWDNTKHNIDELSKHFQVILFDLPGYGGSGKEDIGLEGESRDRTYARLVLSFMDVRGIRKASLYAASASAPSALRFGIDNPDRIEKIVLREIDEVSDQLGSGSAVFQAAKLSVAYLRQPHRSMRITKITRPVNGDNPHWCRE